MNHIFNRWIFPLFVLLPVVAGRWELAVILAGFIITSQSLHESIHHPRASFARWNFRVGGAVLALAGAMLLR